MHTLNSSSSAADYASLLHSEQASLEAALSFLAECDDASGSGGSGASWRLLQDASSHDMDVDIDEGVDDHHHHHHHHQQEQQQHMYGEKPRGQEEKARGDDDDGDDSDDAAMLSALLEAEHIPVMETITTPGAASSFHDAARAGGYASFHGSRSSSSSNLYGFADDSPTSDFTPHHNPGMMMAMMSAGFPTIDFNPQSLLMVPNNDSSGSESNSPMASTTGSASTATSASASASASTSSPSARASTSSTALVRKRPSKKKPAGYNSNRARDERKEELIYLRKTVSEMEERLNKLKQSTPAPAVPPPGTTAAATVTTMTDFSPNSSSSSSTASSSSSTNAVNGGVGNVSSVVTATPAQARTAAAAQQLSNSVWEDIATRQYKERRRAELENIRLKLILEGQIKMAKALEKILKKRTSLRILESVRGSGKRVKCVRRPGDGDAEIFRELLAGVEKTLEEVDAVFEANGLGRMQTAYRDAQLRHDDVNGMVMEIFANKVMPFDMQATASAVWRHYGHSMEHIPSRSYYHKQPPYLETTEDTLVESYGLELHGSRTKGNFLCKQIMRKFEQQERIVIGWRAQAEAVDLSAEPTAGIRLVERGYTVIKELENMATPHTLVQTCYIIRPHVYDAIADQDRKVGALTDFIMNCMAGTISASHQMIENFLLDQALKSK